MQLPRALTFTQPLLCASIGLWALQLTSFAQESTPEPSDRNAFESLFDGRLPASIANGHLNLDIRARYERAEQDTKGTSNAPTVRTLLGYETAPLYGFKLMVEFEDVRIIGSEDQFNQAGLSGAGKTMIADVEGTELNQGWISYERWDTLARVGRQRINLDNQRFVGDVAWRQHDQTFDAATIENKSLPHTVLSYSHLENVNRIFTDGSLQGNFRSDSHLIHACFDGWSLGKVTGYAYLLDFDNSAANSSDTFGLSFVGKHVFDAKLPGSLAYRGEYAHQRDAADNPAKYSADYYTLELGGEIQRFNAGAGYEVLGSDNGVGFSTPLATLHSFNGWADVFLATPAAGLRDLYVWAGVKLPHQIPFKIVYHDFESDRGGLDFGSEWDAVLSTKLGDHWSALLKYADYDSGSTFLDTRRFWVQLEFTY